MYDSRLLIVDDEQSICTMLVTILKKEGFNHIHTTGTAEDALSLCENNEYDLILLDVMLPCKSGFDICPSIRAITNAPIFFLTARASDLDKLSGFALGADDYITKPFNPLEVVARILAHLRRQQTHLASKKLKQFNFGSLEINIHSGEVYKNKTKIDLSAQLFQLLVFLCKHPNQLFSKGQLYEQVWGEPYLGEDNTVMVHIRKLREKIEDNPSDPKWIVTVRGLGYKFVSRDTPK
ncbi:response regulator transcription factor [Cytobacillus kochii]|uniref:response regulator transcription factor n=1 Tax=Cytobacillus kochii TaxID=859143 RepID=UPI00402AC6DC